MPPNSFTAVQKRKRIDEKEYTEAQQRALTVFYPGPVKDTEPTHSHRHLKNAEENQIAVSRLEGKEYQNYAVKPRKTDEPNTESTQLDLVFFNDLYTIIPRAVCFPRDST